MNSAKMDLCKFIRAFEDANTVAHEMNIQLDELPLFRSVNKLEKNNTHQIPVSIAKDTTTARIRHSPH